MELKKGQWSINKKTGNIVISSMTGEVSGFELQEFETFFDDGRKILEITSTVRKEIDGEVIIKSFDSTEIPELDRLINDLTDLLISKA